MGNELGEFLKQLRGKRSLRDIADLTKLSHTYIADIEKGFRRGTKTPLKPSPETLRKLANALDAPYKELMIMAGYWNKDDADTELLYDIYSETRTMEKKIVALLKDIANDENIFRSKYHEEIFKIFGGYASDMEVYERSSFRDRSSFDKWYVDYLKLPDDDKSIEEDTAVEEFNKYYNYRTIKQGMESLDRFIVIHKTLDDFWNELVDFCSRNNIEIGNTIKESPASYTAEKELFDKSLELSDEEIKSRYDFKIDGRELTEEEYKRMIAAVRAERLYRDQNPQ
ncbi:Helix-turn-helix domain protein [compost metagenome]